MATDLGRFMDEQVPILREHFDLQLAAIRANMDAIQADQRAIKSGVEATNARVDAIHSRLTSGDQRSAEILDQVKKTNGRVGELEKARAFEDGVRAGSGSSWRILMAGSTVIGTLVGGSVAVIALVLGR